MEAASQAEAAAAAADQATGDLEDCESRECEVCGDAVERVPDETPLTDRVYRVAWTIDVTAATPREAAQRALQIQRDHESIANYFDVTGPDGITRPIDLLEDDHGTD